MHLEAEIDRQFDAAGALVAAQVVLYLDAAGTWLRVTSFPVDLECCPTIPPVGARAWDRLWCSEFVAAQLGELFSR